jgi:hypothetical protein
MLPEHRVLDDPCPVTDQMLGEMYRAGAHGLNELIATVSPTTRASLAVYCYRRAHLASIGLAIAATCEEEELSSMGGNAGAMLFERSRKAPLRQLAGAGTSNRRKITLSVGPLRTPIAEANKEGPPLSFLGSIRTRLWPKVEEQTPGSD